MPTERATPALSRTTKERAVPLPMGREIPNTVLDVGVG